MANERHQHCTDCERERDTKEHEDRPEVGARRLHSRGNARENRRRSCAPEEIHAKFMLDGLLCNLDPVA